MKNLEGIMDGAQWKVIRSKLEKISPHDLVGVIKELYDLNAQNELFLETRFGNRHAGFEEYKLIIEESICPSEPWHRDVSLSTGRKAISDYKKAVGDPAGLLELMIYYCECGVNFTLQFGDIDERFYMSLESMYASVLKLLQKHPEHKDEFFKRVKDILRRTQNMGWGFHDTLYETFYTYYEDAA